MGANLITILANFRMSLQRVLQSSAGQVLIVVSYTGHGFFVECSLRFIKR